MLDAFGRSAGACCVLKVELVRMPGCNIVGLTWPNDHNIMQHPQMLHETFDHFQIWTCRNTSQQAGQTRATCCAQHCCGLLLSNVAIVWPGLYTIGLKNSRHFFIQSEVKAKPTVTRSHAFSRASLQLNVLLVLIGSLYCPRLLWLARVITLVLVSRRDLLRHHYQFQLWVGSSLSVIICLVTSLFHFVIRFLPAVWLTVD